ncbi:hypothetical protein RHMOL_RhmolUnG0005500 [Rhododendron molle]|nr:hypothetical protein RHMOL_RhmolUnG0005500 [Rhododendron molle]
MVGNDVDGKREGEGLVSGADDTFRSLTDTEIAGVKFNSEDEAVDENDRLETLFWTNRRSTMDYAAFEDVLVFDTTYRTNAYKKPFVILAGVSNNFMTTIFGCALLSKETEQMYNWVLETFMETMDALMLVECEVEEFDSLWADMVSHYGVEINAWVLEMYSDRERSTEAYLLGHFLEMYSDRERWTEAYLLGHFFVGMRSTQ